MEGKKSGGFSRFLAQASWVNDGVWIGFPGEQAEISRQTFPWAALGPTPVAEAGASGCTEKLVYLPSPRSPSQAQVELWN